VSFAAIFSGALLVVAARSERVPLVLDRRWRSPLLIPAVALLVFSFVSLVGNNAEGAALDAASRGDWKKAASEARRARTWAPWSAQPLVLEADVATARNDTPAARALLRRAVEKDPHDFVLWNRLSLVTIGAESRRARERTSRLNPLG
jgi:hypothetical protein